MLLKLSRSTRALDLDAILTGKSAPAMQLPKVAPPKITPSPSEEESAPKKSAPQPKPAPAPEPEATSEAPELIKPEPVKETVKKPEQVPPLEPVVVEEIIPEPTPEPVPEAVPEVKEVLEVESNPPADEQSSDINIEELLPHWEKFIESLGKISRSTSAFMSEGTPAGFEKGCLTVSFAPEQKYHIQTLSKNTDDIHKIASEVFGTKMTILLLEENGRKPKQRKEDEILAHPTSQHLLDIFDGEIIDE